MSSDTIELPPGSTVTFGPATFQTSDGSNEATASPNQTVSATATTPRRESKIKGTLARSVSRTSGGVRLTIRRKPKVVRKFTHTFRVPVGVAPEYLKVLEDSIKYQIESAAKALEENLQEAARAFAALHDAAEWVDKGEDVRGLPYPPGDRRPPHSREDWATPFRPKVLAPRISGRPYLDRQQHRGSTRQRMDRR